MSAAAIKAAAPAHRVRFEGAVRFLAGLEEVVTLIDRGLDLLRVRADLRLGERGCGEHEGRCEKQYLRRDFSWWKAGSRAPTVRPLGIRCTGVVALVTAFRGSPGFSLS